jgi:hypothetical protein
VPEWQAEDDRNFQGSQRIQNDILGTGRLPLRIDTVKQVAHSDPRESVELSRSPELVEQTVEDVGLLADILEEQDRAAGVHLPRRPEAGRQQGERAADQRALSATAPMRLSLQDRCGVATESADQRLQLLGKHSLPPLEHRSVEPDQAGALSLPEQQCRDVAEPDQWLGCSADAKRIQIGDDAVAAIAAAGTEDGIDAVVVDQIHELADPPAIVAGQIPAAIGEIIPTYGCEAGLPELVLAGLDGLRVDGEGGSRDSDGGAGRERADFAKSRHLGVWPKMDEEGPASRRAAGKTRSPKA